MAPSIQKPSVDQSVGIPKTLYQKCCSGSKVTLVAFIVIGLIGVLLLSLGGAKLLGFPGTPGFFLPLAFGGALSFISAVSLGYNIYSRNKKESAVNPEVKVETKSTERSEVVKPEAKNESKDAKGRTELYLTVKAHNIAMLDKFHESGADFKTTNAKGVSLLHKVAVWEEKDSPAAAIEKLIGYGSDPNARDGESQTPLHCAAYLGSAEAASKLIEKGAKVNAQAKNKCTPLHEAVSMGNKAVYDILVQNGADLNAKDDQDETPLHNASLGPCNEALKVKRKAIIKDLLSRGAQETKDRAGKTPRNYAVESGLGDAFPAV